MIVRRMIRRMLAAGLGLATVLAAAPPLTTIQDVLYKADGTRFNGTAAIGWSSFEAADQSAITMHGITVKIVDGQFRVQLVPNAGVTPPAYYTVKYSSDGKIQFEETWSVPASARAVRVRDVRVTAPAQLDTGTAPIQQSDVVGLTAELNARPMRGAGYAPGRVAVVGPTGAIESASGNDSDCVRVDGSAGPCGGAGADFGFNDNETPAGMVDGANTGFTLAATPEPPGSLTLYRNGILQKRGEDYSLSDRAITFAAEAVPQPGDTLLASYRTLGSGNTASAPQVLCSGTGASTGATQAVALGSCLVRANTLRSGDRVEVQFDYAHGGTEAGFGFEVRWGSTSVAARSAAASEALVSGRAEAAVAADGTQIGAQTWGASLPLAAGVVSAADDIGQPLTIEFRGNVAAPGSDTLRLRHYTVIRYPAVE